MEDKYNHKAQFNLGDAYYEQGNYEESSKCFTDIVNRNVPENVEADAYYNLGNTLMAQEKYAEAFDAYKTVSN